MNGAEFIRRTRRYARKKRLTVRIDARYGKGSHSRIYLGNNYTLVQRGELKRAVFRAMLKKLGIAKEDF